LGFTPAGEVRRVVAQAASLGAQRFAAVVPDDAYGAKVAAALKSAVETTGGTITRVELLDPKATDFTPVIRRLTEGGRPAEARPGTMPASGPPGQPQPSVAASSIPGTPSARPSALATSPAPGASPPALPFDALLVAVGGKRLQTFAAYLSAAGIDGSRVRLLGTGIWDEPGLGAEPALVGGWFAAAPPDLRQDFARQYRQVFGDAPPRLASLAYDATAMAAVLAQALAGGPFLPEYLTDPSGFLGRDGLFRLGADGIAERKLAVLEITRDGAVVISDAPSSFAGF
jgi:ABC-type branched-subunit amino acid transport system substrate-binding protein